MMRLKSDLTVLVEAALDGKLDQVKTNGIRARASVSCSPPAAIRIAAQRRCDSRFGSGSPPSGKIFHAGTQLRDNDVITSGGRVLCAVGLGDTVYEAQQQAIALPTPLPGMAYISVATSAIARWRASGKPKNKIVFNGSHFRAIVSNMSNGA